jgi:NAD(P)H-dependent flavin oxidoreductase YrpB (nitropropane dioxygenase family)
MPLVETEKTKRTIMKTYSKIAIAAGVAVIGGVAVASAVSAHGGFGKRGGHWGGGFGGPAAMLMEQIDANQDDKLTQAEIDEAIRSRLASADMDGDGKLNLDEFQPILIEIMRPKIVDGFQFLDANGDAVITLEEIDRPMSRVVSRLDRNDDGELTSDELRKRHRGWRHGHHDDDDDEDDN